MYDVKLIIIGSVGGFVSLAIGMSHELNGNLKFVLKLLFTALFALLGVVGFGILVLFLIQYLLTA